MDVRTALPEGTELRLEGRVFRIGACTGRGASALVYRASYEDAAQPGLFHRVLLKELFPWHPQGAIRRGASGEILCGPEGEALLETHRQSFLRAARIHVRLQAARADKTPANLDTCRANGTLYAVMSDGGAKTLADVLSEGRVPLPAMTAWLVNLLYTLRVFHEEGLLHLDVSPDNILLQPLDEGKPEKYREVLLIDYNSAWSADELAARRELFLSLKEPWSAPELQLRDVAAVGPASDLYSVCMILLQYLLGYPPVRQAVWRKVPPIAGSPALSGCSAVVFHQAASILRRGLKASPGQRFQSAQEAVAAFSELLDRLEHGGVTHGAVWEASAARLRAERSRMPSAAEWGELAEERASLLETLERAGNVQLTGGSGSGKTTLLAGLWLRGLRAYSPACAVPVFLPLCGYDGSADFVRRSLLSMLSPGEGRTWEEARLGLERLLDAPGGGVLLLLDGFEEAGGDTAPLRAELRALTALRGVRVIVSARRAVPELGLPELSVPPLSAAEIEAYLARRGVELPQGGQFPELLHTPVFLSIYARTDKARAGKRPEDNDRAEDEALLDDYLDSLVSAAGEALGEEAAVRAGFAVRVLLPCFAWRMGQRPALSAEGAGSAAAGLFSAVRRGRVSRSFPQYLGRNRALLGGAKDADDWFGLMVRGLLERRMALVWQDGDGAYHLFHQYFQPILASRWPACRKRLRRSRLRRILPAAAAAAVLLAGVGVWRAAAEHTPSAVQRREDTALAVSELSFGCGLLDLQLSAQDRLLTAAESLPAGDEAAWEDWLEQLDRETALLDAQEAQSEAGERALAELSDSGLPLDVMETLLALPETNRSEWALQAQALTLCLAPDSPYGEADRLEALRACRGLCDSRTRESFLLISRTAAGLSGEEAEPLLSLLARSESWRAYAYQTINDSESCERGLTACRGEQEALWETLASLGLLNREETP